MASGASKFKFISPGIFINEIDESKLPADPAVDPGPTIIGRARKGPGLVPTTVSSFDEFVQVFGTPDPGAEGGDNWRNNDFDGPTYGAYAAQAWLVSEQSPVNYVRLLGAEDPLNTGTAASKAGWITDSVTPAYGCATNGGAYGLFVVDSGSYSGSEGKSYLTGTLAAVWYLQGGTITLSGTLLQGPAAAAATASAGSVMASDGASSQFKAVIQKSDGSTQQITCFNFDPASDKYIRKVFNKNPSQTNSDLVSTSSPSHYNYWLGETYDQYFNSLVSGSAAEETQAFIIALESGSTNRAEMQNNLVNAETPYFFGQDLNESTNYQENSMQSLFKLVALETGEAGHRQKISIANIQAAPYPDLDPYGTFSVLVRASNDNDKAPVVIERFDECNLNPLSDRYVAKLIGDHYVTWDGNESRFRHYGNYANQSDYVRVVVDAEVDAGGSTIAQMLPAGYLGPFRYKGFFVASGSVDFSSFDDLDPIPFAGTPATTVTRVITMVSGGKDIPSSSLGQNGTSSCILTTQADTCLSNPSSLTTARKMLGFAAKYSLPTFLTRTSASEGGMNPNSAYFGVRTSKTAETTTFDASYYDVCRPLLYGASKLSSFGNSGQPALERGFVFSLDNIVSGNVAGDTRTAAGEGFYYVSGSRKAGCSYSAQPGKSLRVLLEAGVDKFTAPLHGGFDGLDISEREPFRNSQWTDSSTSRNSYSLNTLQRAIATTNDPERVVTNLITVPGVWRKQVTDDVIDVCEGRGDALALIDIEDAGTPPNTEGTAFSEATARRPSVTGSVTKLRSRLVNSSYACTYFPWVKVRDPNTTAVIDMPPSVPALGTFASSQARTELWFAPAGFVRGGLSNGAAGLPVVGLTYRPTSKERDALYQANINPIAQFPNEGIVIFGQKTLQVTRSALDRINVRRLMIFVKKEISKMASTVLFDPNTDVTWSRFTSKVNPFLASVKSRFGLSDFLVVLDKTTTTDDLVDRNIMYAKIFLKPTKAIEFIALDFIITRQGASFND